MSLQIRPIRDSAEDLARCLEIYNYYIENTVITFEETPLSAEAWTDRIRRIRDAYPFLVAEEDGVIVGYAYLDSYNSRSAYRYTADLSIYPAASAPACCKQSSRKPCSAVLKA